MRLTRGRRMIRRSLDKAARTVALAFKRRTRTEMTLEGKIFAAMAIALGVVAVNTGINLLYFVLATILASIAVSGIASEICLRGIDVHRSAPRRAQCGEVAAVWLRVKNRKRFFPSPAIYLEDWVSSKRARLRMQCFAAKVDPGGEISLAYNVKFERRGPCNFGPVTVSTQFPFGLFKKSLPLPKTDQTIVLPMCSRVDGQLLTRIAGLLQAHRPRRQIISGQGDFRALREFRQGDNIKLVHWRSSARFSKLMLKELEREESSNFTILLNAISQNGASSGCEEAFERVVSAAASLARYLIKEGHIVSCISLGQGCDYMGMGSGNDHLWRIMERLALVELTASGSLQDATEEAYRLIPKGSIVLALGFEKEEPFFETISSKLASKGVWVKKVIA